jgi:hypothetical protein
MAKTTHVRRKQLPAQTVALPTAENAKWLAIGFLTALGIFMLSLVLLISSHLH